MQKKSLFRMTALLAIAMLLISGCSPQAASPSPTTETDPGAQIPTDAPTAANTPLGEATATPTEAAAQPTPTAEIVETRLPPERWQEWPVVPELTGREKEIYQRGLSLGNDPHSFSKVGDCQAIKDVLLGIYDQPDRYVLTAEDAYLQETIDNFAGSFDRDGQGVRGGFNTAAVLSPLWADPSVCQPGETPIECEDRTHNPSFVIISLEVWWEGRTVERYEDYMRQIIDFYIEQGVVPILSTKADNVEGDHRINLATARLAYEYHLPLWNFWLAVQPLPNHGIDPERDGFHISYDAWTVRSYTALQALDAVWRGVRDEAPAAETVVTPTEPAVTFAELQFSPAPDGAGPLAAGAESLVFSIEQRQDEATQSAGVFAYDLTAQTLHRILDAGYQLEDLDPSGTRLLVSQGSQLFISDLTGQTEPVTDKLALTGRGASAFWYPDGSHLLVLTDEAGPQTLWRVDPAADAWEALAEGQITGMIKPVGDATVYWYAGECTPDTACDQNTLWRTQAGASESFAKAPQAAVSADGGTYAWTETAEGQLMILYTRGTDQSGQDYLYLPGNRTVDLAWAPLGNRLALLTVTRDDYTGKSSDARIFVVDANSMTHLEYYAFPGLNPAATWSPDSGSLLLTSTLADDEGYQLQLRLMNLTSGLFDTLSDTLAITSPDFINIDPLFWIMP